MAEKKGLVLDAGAMKKLKVIMDSARTQADYGNDRFVRNIIEKARMVQNSRLIRMDFDSVTADDVKTICAEDIEEPKIDGRVNRPIGFAVA